MSEKAPWITYRPELKVLDCTVRDGGLVNSHRFTDEFVRAVYDACVGAGIDYMEVGYKNSTRRLSADRIRTLATLRGRAAQSGVAHHDAKKSGLKLAAMADAGKSDWRDVLVPCNESVLDMIRVAFYAHQVSEAVEMIEYAAELGYETSANLMAVSSISEVEIDTVLDAIRTTRAGRS